MALILVVDDSPMIQKVAKAVLTKMGHEVHIVGVVKSALARIQGETFDLILMDLNLPDMRGDEAIKIIREHMHVEAPIIVFSGEIKTDVMMKLQPLGISAFVAKGEEFVFRLTKEVNRALSNGG